MSSGKRESVVIFCLSTVSGLYLPSLKFYRPDHVAVFMDAGSDPVSELEREVYKSVRDSIHCEDIAEYPVDTHDYESVLGRIVDVKKSYEKEYGDDLDVFINISSGTKEFAAAGMFASMIPRQAIAFKVDMRSSGMTAGQLRQLVSAIDEGMSVDLPKKVTSIENEDPDEEMVGFLRILSELLRDSRNPRHEDIIRMLKGEGLWFHDPRRKSNYGRTPLEQKEEMYLKRHYFAPALENGWIDRPTSHSVIITDKGRAYVSVFKSGSRPDEDALCCKCECNEIEFDSGISPDFDHTQSSPQEFYDEEVSYRFRKNGKKYRFHVWMD